MMDEFLTFLGQYDSDYPSSVRGASAERIERLSAVMGQPIPPIHEEFLLRMGSSLGRLEIPNLSFDIEQLIGLYEAEEWRPPPRYAVIAVQLQDPYFDCYRPQCLLLEREDAAIHGHLPPRGGFNAKAAATDRGQLSKLCEILRDQTILV
ncbi:MAG TPA: hypothetical protein VFZ09_44005 [Archangium sp.]|uniref:hypothetical protein n=1 Tax=Archangium sp. TaxID=1872627 RepID=UPI002E30D21E|nr:hypothetical protein [Archangium sp.]HEX5753246.1 hypothetical protein [Archangium sp.]